MLYSSEGEHALNDSDRRRHFWWLVAGAWTILAFFMASQLVLLRPHIPWLTTLVLEFLYSAQWVALLPLTFQLMKRFPFGRRKWITAVLAHLTTAVLLSSLTMAIRTVLIWLLLDAMQTALSMERVVNNMTSAFDYGIMSYLLNLLFGYSFMYYEQLRQRERRAMQLESELQQAQLQALKMHLHPHFLFNTLNAIAILIRKNEHEVAVEMISRLSKFLRYTLENVNTQQVSIREEVETMELYLDIQQVRFKDRLIITKHIAPDVVDAAVPTLILQPLVENAFRHGIAVSESSGRLEISVERHNGMVDIRISDDGPGIRADWKTLQGNGVGLQNTQSRLEKLYGTSFIFELLDRHDHGAIAHLAIPFSRYTERVMEDVR